MKTLTKERNNDGTFMKGICYSPSTVFKKGMKMPKEVIEKRTKSVLGKKRPRQSLKMRGEKCNFWKGGITKKNKMIRNLYEYKLWRESIFKRDDWTCQNCKIRSGVGVKVILEADHIIPFAIMLEKNNIKTSDEARSCDELWDINNGRTLCRDCHKKTETYLGSYYNYKKQL